MPDIGNNPEFTRLQAVVIGILLAASFTLYVVLCFWVSM